MKTSLPAASRIIGLLCLTAGAACLFRASARAASYEAHSWDTAMTLGPGGYRAQKPIELKGEFDVKLMPGAFLEGVAFLGKDAAQHWKINGGFLRKCKIAGQLGVSLDANDSVFEDCDLFKDSGWFVSWWGTHWKFTNCIFAKKFLRNDLPPNDYSVHAARCTFYNIKLPPIGIKEDAAKYMQKEDMGFEKCRFVGCDVPESFLAATLDCVFENCQFAGKHQNWPKETSAIKVSAYYAGSLNSPHGIMNGPLSVVFDEAPKVAEAGCTIPHTQSGGRVTVTNKPEPLQFAAMGVTPKWSSDMPVAPGGGTGESGAASATIFRGPIEVETRTLSDILLALPASIPIASGADVNAAGVAAANEWLAKTYQGKPFGGRMIVDSGGVYKEDAYAFELTSRDQSLLTRGFTTPARLVAHFRAGAAASLAHITKNADTSIHGTIEKAVLDGKGRSLSLTVTIGEAQIP